MISFFIWGVLSPEFYAFNKYAISKTYPQPQDHKLKD